MVPFVWRNPAEIDDEVRAFATSLVPGGTPIFIRVKPPAFARLYDCYRNATRTAQLVGGSMLLGWDISEDTDQLLFQAVFHAVWQSLQGEIIDVTPSEAGFTQTLFVPDRKIEFPDGDVPNRFQARIDDPILQRAIRVLAWEDSMWDTKHVRHTSTVHFTRSEKRQRERMWGKINPGLEELRRRQQQAP
mgnify:CR=1 FL=1